VARQAALAMAGEVAGGATLLGDGRRTTVGGACLANSALFHGRAQEDTCGAAHFGTILIPMLTALIETRRYPLDRLVPALVAGYEAGGLLEAALAGETTPRGFRSTATYGAIAAAAAAARLMGLDAATTGTAVAVAASFTGGVLQSFADGTDEWRYQPGMVAQGGLAAAELARAGAVAAPLALEGKAGLARSFAGVAPPEGLAARLGQDWATLRVTFKPFPVCAFNQTPVTGALALRDALGGEAPQAVRVRMNPYETGYAGMDATGPFHSVSGTLMSIPFCIATTLLHGVPTMRHMTTYDDPDVAALIARTRLVTDPSVPVLSAILEVDTAQGTRVHKQPMTPADYAYDRATLAAMLRRIGAEQEVPMAAFDRLEAFVDRLPAGDIGAVLAAFELMPRPGAARRAGA
ncbi:MAG: MmgE/PrpD family protein, partial [Rhodospirillales bacterium]|nr:MmgE/PrpD family protein [Rhodospirillales bacterium]